MTREERVQTLGEAKEALSAHLTTAVRACLRSSRPVAFQLSGGLDSSTVVSLAHRLGVDRPATFSLVFPDVPDADESPYINAVVEAIDARAERLTVPRASRAELHADIEQHGDLPHDANGWPLQGVLLHAAAARGHAVCLTGLGSDQWLTGSLMRQASLIRRGRFAALARFIREVRGGSAPLGWDRGALIDYGLRPLIPEAVKRLARPFVRFRPPPWIPAAFARRVGLRERLRASAGRVVGRIADPLVRESVQRVTAGGEALAHELVDRMGARAGLELRSPFYDRRVLECMLSLPDDLRLRGGRSKFVLREAMAGILPERVRTRTDKAGMEHMFVDAVRTLDPARALSSMQTVDRGWIDPAPLRAAWEIVRDSSLADPRMNPSADMLWHALGAEAWVRHVFP
jgi:asparagine synthase (glutamine-hydrolysing)